MVAADALQACETPLTKRPRNQPPTPPPIELIAAPVAPIAPAAGTADLASTTALDVGRWEDEGGAAPRSADASTISETTPAEKAEQDAVPEIEAPETPTIDEGVATLQAAMAAPLHPAVVASLRENLIGTIDVWSDAGIAEIGRVRDLLADHGDWTAEEVEKAIAAFAAIADCALAAAKGLEIHRTLEWLDDASQAIEDLGLDPADILDLNPETGNVVMNDGRRITLDR